MTKVTWGMDDKHYVRNGKLGYLHIYMMKKWYGEDMVDNLHQSGWIVEHMNNRGNDCRISNLTFMLGDENKAKGFSTDKYIDELQWHLAVSMFHDFSTQCYQVTIGCNDAIITRDDTGKQRHVQDIRLLYDYRYQAYNIVVNEVTHLLLTYRQTKRFSLSGMTFCKKRVDFCPDFELSEDEYKQAIVRREEVPYIVLGNGMSWINSVHYTPGWKPDD